MATILDFPTHISHAQSTGRSSEFLTKEHEPSSSAKFSFFRHIDEVFDDYQNKQATLTEVSSHVKTIISDLVDKLDKPLS